MTQPQEQDPTGNSREGQSPPATTHRRFQFGIRGLFVAVFGVAVGLSLLNVEGTHYSDCILTSVSVWFMLGLLWQAWDFFRVLWRNRTLHNDRRLPLCFAIAWRIAIAASFVVHYVLLQLIGTGQFKIHDHQWEQLTEKKLLQILFLLSMLVVLWSLRVVKKRKRGWYSRTITFFGIIACAIWLLYCFLDMSCLPILGFIAVFSCEAAEPLDYTYCAFGYQYTQGHYNILFGSLYSLLFLVLSSILCIKMIRRWQRTNKVNIILAVPSFVCLVLASLFPIWVYTYQMDRFPWAFSQGLWWQSGFIWTMAGFIFLACVSGVTWLLTRRLEMPSDMQATRDRPQGRVYYHEQAIVCGCLLAGMFCVLIKMFPESQYYHSILSWFAIPRYCVPLAAFLMSARIFWQRLRRPGDLPSPTSYRVSPACYAVTWLNVFGILLVGTATLAWMGFSIWMVPYWTSYW